MAFPTTSVLDNFNRTNEGPPPSASWSGPVFSGHGQLKVSSNTCIPDGAGNKNDYWNVATFGPDSEAFVTITSKGATAWVDVFVRLASPGTTGVDGYSVEMDSGAATVTHYRIDNGVLTALGSAISQAFSNGDALGLKIVGSTLQAYRQPSGGSWATLGTTRSDSTYTAAGNIGLHAANTSVVMDDFGGGTALPVGTGLLEGLKLARRRRAY